MLVFMVKFLRWLLCLLEGKPAAQQKPPDTVPGSQRKVVILGGGVAGVAAAFWLSAPELNNRFKVTLYTQGWRLGGKCASGRNKDRHDSIEEHGLHLLMGCYENAFTTIRACYAEWQRPTTHPFKTWQDAFLPQRQITLMEQDGPGAPPSWAAWDFPNFPSYPGEPGEEPGAQPASDAALLAAAMDVLVLRMAELMDHIQLPAEAASSYAAAVMALKGALSGDASLAGTADALRQLELARAKALPT